MVLFNYSTKELTAKVVYYGPGLCGKTTNLQWIHEKLPIKNKGKMLSLATETDRTLFFDFLPIEIGTIRGMKTRIQLYTVPGQVFYNATRRMVLKGADAVVFVCDSQEATFEGNLESFENLRQNLSANDIDPDEIPVVLQYNKRDLPSALPIEILNERLNPRGYPWLEAVACKGIGVEETLKAVTKVVFKSLSSRYGDGGAPLNRPPVSRPSPESAQTPPAGVPAAVAPPAAAPAQVRPQRPPAAVPPRPVARAVVPEARPPAPVVAPVAAPAPPPEPDGLDLDLGSIEPLSAPDEAQAGIPTRPPVPPTPPPPATRPADSTMVTRRDEADDLRRRIATPGLDDEVVELEELEPELEPDQVPRLVDSAPPLAAPSFPPRPAPAAAAVEPPNPPTLPRLPQPSDSGKGRAGEVDNPALRTSPALVNPAPPEIEVAQPFEAGAAGGEVEVPIDVEIAPGTTRLTLRLKLTLSFKR